MVDNGKQDRLDSALSVSGASITITDNSERFLSDEKTLYLSCRPETGSARRTSTPRYPFFDMAHPQAMDDGKPEEGLGIY